MIGLILTIVLLLVSIALAIPIGMLWMECCAALFFSSTSTSLPQTEPPTLAVLIPAHNEASGIGPTLAGLLPQVPQGDRIIVIADNCSDTTAEVARQMGVTVLERQDQERRGKGYALDFGLRYLEANPPDVVVMVDADCRVEADGIKKIAIAAKVQQRPVQALYLMETPPEPSPKASISALAFLVKNWVRPQGLENLGFPCLLTGTGMAFPWSVIRDAAIASGNIVEDMQLGIDLAIAGFPPLFCPDAKVTGILPQEDSAATRQRTRWEHGHLQTLLTQVPRILTAAWQQKRLDLLGMAFDLSVPPLSLLVFLYIGAFFITLFATLFGVGTLPFILLILEGVLLALSIIGAWDKFGRSQIPLQTLLAIPRYILWKIPLYFQFLTKPQQEWVRTTRDAVASAPPQTQEDLQQNNIEPLNPPITQEVNPGLEKEQRKTKIAYLINQYPKVSHSFIRREIRAVEAAGLDIYRFSIRSCESELVDEGDKEELAKTEFVLGVGAKGLLINTLNVVRNQPLKVLKVLALTVKIGWNSERGLLYHFAYLAEACVLLNWCKAKGIQHIHTHFGTNSTTVALLCQALGGPSYSFTVHGPEEFDKPQAIALPEKIKQAQFVVAISHFGKSQLFRWCEASDWSKIYEVRCGVDDSFLAQPFVPIPSERRFVCVGRLSEQKGHLLLIEAAHQLVTQGFNFKLIFVGDGPLRNQIESRIRQLGLENTIEITGWASNAEVKQQILDAQVLVQPSFAEGLPVVIMEALALCRPVISTYIAGIPELVETGTNGLLVPAGSVEELAIALKAAMETPPEVLETLGKAGAQRVAQLHNITKEAEKLATLFVRS